MSTDPRLETLRLLTSIDATLKAIAQAILDYDNQIAAKHAPASTDALCNGPYGDPIIKAKSPRDWNGPDMIGRHFSECPADYLELLAARYDYFASKEEDSKKQKYNLLDAQRCRAWAVRIRGGYVAPAQASNSGFVDDGSGDF
jgi:hypothetical protein